MTNDAMTKADAARERVLAAAFYAACEAVPDGSRKPRAFVDPSFKSFEEALTAYGDRRAIAAEIAALRKAPCIEEVNSYSECNGTQCRRCRALADAEQREKEMG